MSAQRSVIISAPGKVILHGEHAVVYGKAAIAASLNLRTYLGLNVSTDMFKVSVSLPDIKIEKEWSVKELKTIYTSQPCSVHSPEFPNEDILAKLYAASGIQHGEHDTRKLALVAFLYLLLCISWNDGSVIPITVNLSSSLPTGAGLGSSSAFSTSLAAGLLLIQGFISTPSLGTENYQGTWEKPEDLDLINKWAFMAEKVIHGNPSGIDNSISTYGGALRFQKGELAPMDETPQLKILLSNTSVPRSTKTMVAGVREKVNKYPAIMEPVLASVQAISEESLKVLAEIARHEYARSNNDTSVQHLFKTLEDLIDMNQHHLNIMGVSHPKLEQICGTTLKHGLHTKLTGAGGGGCAFTLIPPGTADGIVQAIQEELRATGIDSWVTSIGGRGVSYHTSLDGENNVPEIFRV